MRNMQLVSWISARFIPRIARPHKQVQRGYELLPKKSGYEEQPKNRGFSKAEAALDHHLGAFTTPAAYAAPWANEIQRVGAMSVFLRALQSPVGNQR